MKIITVLYIAYLFGQELEPGAPTISSRAAEEKKRLEEAARLPDSRKRLALVELVKTAQDDPATDALSRLIRSNDPEAVALSGQLISRFNSTAYIGRIVSSVANHFSPLNRHQIARQLLQKVNRGYSGEKPGIPVISLAGYSAELLADSQLASDQALVQSQWERNPEELGYLNALTSLGVRRGSGEDISKKLFAESSRPLWVRVAAAAVLSEQDKQAAAFCANELDKLLDDFGSRDGMEMLLSQNRPTTNFAGGTPLVSNKLPVAAISILQWLRTTDAERLTFYHLDSRNIWQNRALAMIAADRWPERLIKLSANPDPDRKRVLATLCVMHPSLESFVAEVIPRSEFPKLLHRQSRLGCKV